ncbi:hypothetical protein PINS_up021586 [Pythium insidiosum]|nr:hypothetical protein PINS_up021586 [Pythium insidiosum]
MFERCYATGEFKQALGIALEARRLDQVEACITRAPDASQMLAYCFEVCRTIVASRDFRLQVYAVMVRLYRAHAATEYSGVCQCLQMLDNHADVTKLLEQLVRSAEPNDALVAYQVAFDLSANENQKFLLNIYHSLPSPPKPEEPTTAATTTTETEAEASTAPVAAAPAATPVPAGAPSDYWARLDRLKLILSGEFLVDLSLDFLHRSSDSDPLLMKTIKTAVENRNSVLHHSAVIAHAYLNAGTTNDSFLRENLEWLGKATNWAKFTATASLGVVHKGHVRETMNLLAPYLSQGGVSASPYSEGGALYAMGLIHANKGLAGASSKTTMEYLRNALRNAGSDETVQHGACLGIGLCGLASHDYELYEELKNVMFTDSAVAGEGAGLAIGLVLLGAGSGARQGEIVKDLLAYAHDTKHEKIIRGAMMGIALMMYETEEQADALIEQLLRDKDPLVRYGGIYATAMAYVGTSNNTAIRRLLHVAVSDVSDDVRRAAVTCLGFVLFRTPVQVPKLVSLLSESFNPHVRYGACLAVGIACAGTAKNEAIQLLEPLLDDPVDYVRQGALMALAMVLMQESEGRNSKVTDVREKILKHITDKHVTTMTKVRAVDLRGERGRGERLMMRCGDVVFRWEPFWRRAFSTPADATSSSRCSRTTGSSLCLSLCVSISSLTRGFVSLCVIVVVAVDGAALPRWRRSSVSRCGRSIGSGTRCSTFWSCRSSRRSASASTRTSSCRRTMCCSATPRSRSLRRPSAWRRRRRRRRSSSRPSCSPRPRRRARARPSRTPRRRRRTPSSSPTPPRRTTRPPRRRSRTATPWRWMPSVPPTRRLPPAVTTRLPRSRRLP